MATGFRVRYRSMDQSIQGERLLFQLPIRIGRNPLNHCQVVHGYISDFHAVIEANEMGQLFVRDLNSKNGIFTPSGERFARNVPAPLSPINNTFILGGLLRIQVEVVEQDRALGERMSATNGSVIGNRAALGVGSAPPPGMVPGRPPSWDPRYEVAPLPPLSGGDGSPYAARPPVVPSPPGLPNDPWRAGPSGQLRGRDLPALAPVPDGVGPGARPMHSPSGAGNDPRGVGRNTQHFSMGIETMALLGLRELAGSLLPGVPLQTTGDVARLLTKLHDTVEVFCRCFVPLREGYTQFISQMDLRRAASQRGLNRSASALQVEVAQDPATVAAALLDWRNQDYDAPGVVEGIFADLMIHQLAFLEGVMRGVQALLEELSPDRIERLFDNERPAGVSAMLGRYRALWKTFQLHYEELSNETRTFELVFGSDFATSYREYLSRRERPTT
jgi:type VI secretion system protein ImpI